LGLLGLGSTSLLQAQTQKPVLHGRHWVAITGKPLGAVAGARMFERGGNAIDAACAMLGVVCTMFDDVSWGGETQALIFDPHTRRVIGINALGVAPTGATPAFFRDRQLRYPPSEGPLAAVTPGNPGGLMIMLAEYGTLSLREVLEPSIQMADGYPIEEETVRKLERYAAKHRQWPSSRRVLLPHGDRTPPWPQPGELFCQPDLKQTLQRLVEAETEALRAGKSRRDAILAAYDRCYRGDIAEAFVRGSRELGGLHTLADLANWNVKIEEPVSVTYRGIEVYKLTCWTQGPAMLQALNLLEPLDLKAMGYNSARYIHALYQAMNLAFADRDFYYGDPAFPPDEPLRGLLSKDYARERWKQVDWNRNNPDLRPGDPYPFQGGQNPFLPYLDQWSNLRTNQGKVEPHGLRSDVTASEAFLRGTTSIQAADAKGWAISVTPSGGWLPACIAGDTGIAMSQRMQSFVLEEAENPFNVVAPGKRPRVTLTPSLALKDGRPFLCFSVQGGDTQDQNLLQFFLNVVDFGMTVQEACEAANITSYQMRASFEQHAVEPGRLTLHREVPGWVRRELQQMGYRLDYQDRTSGPITAIYFDAVHGTFWGGASNHGEDYGVAW
jgi:gamma-glutamyltranspeptidase/glutathione hydrolase